MFNFWFPLCYRIFVISLLYGKIMFFFLLPIIWRISILAQPFSTLLAKNHTATMLDLIMWQEFHFLVKSTWLTTWSIRQMSRCIMPIVKGDRMTMFGYVKNKIRVSRYGVRKVAHRTWSRCTKGCTSLRTLQESTLYGVSSLQE